jgi:hypothetical protein
MPKIRTGSFPPVVGCRIFTVPYRPDFWYRFSIRTKASDQWYSVVMAGCDRIGHCMAEKVSPVVQRVGLRSVTLPVLVLQRFVRVTEPGTADRRIRIPAGMPAVMTASAVPRPFRSGRWSPCAISARADTVRIRVSTPRMIVKAARSFRCAFIGGFLFTRVNRDHWVSGYFNSAIPSKIAPTCRKKENFRMVS